MTVTEEMPIEHDNPMLLVIASNHPQKEKRKVEILTCAINRGKKRVESARLLELYALVTSTKSRADRCPITACAFIQKHPEDSYWPQASSTVRFSRRTYNSDKNEILTRKTIIDGEVQNFSMCPNHHACLISCTTRHFLVALEKYVCMTWCRVSTVGHKHLMIYRKQGEIVSTASSITSLRNGDPGYSYFQ